MLVKNVGPKQRVISGVTFNADTTKLLLFTEGKWEEAAGYDPSSRRRSRNRLLRSEEEINEIEDNEMLMKIVHSKAEIESLRMEITRLKKSTEEKLFSRSGSDEVPTGQEKHSEDWVVLLLGFIVCILIFTIVITLCYLRKAFTRLEQMEQKLQIPAGVSLVGNTYQKMAPLA